MPPLVNPKHEFFAHEIASGKPQVEAYILAGYAEDHGNASNLAGRPEVAQRVQEITSVLASRRSISADRVLAELARLGFADITQALSVKRGKVTVKDTDTLPADLRAAISEISQSRDGVKVKFHDKVAALDKLGKHLGLWKDAGDVNLTVSLVDLVNGSYKLEAGELTSTDGKVIEAQPEPPASGEKE